MFPCFCRGFHQCHSFFVILCDCHFQWNVNVGLIVGRHCISWSGPPVAKIWNFALIFHYIIVRYDHDEILGCALVLERPCRMQKMKSKWRTLFRGRKMRVESRFGTENFTQRTQRNTRSVIYHSKAKTELFTLEERKKGEKGWKYKKWGIEIFWCTYSNIV